MYCFFFFSSVLNHWTYIFASYDVTSLEPCVVCNKCLPPQFICVKAVTAKHKPLGGALVLPLSAVACCDAGPSHTPVFPPPSLKTIKFIFIKTVPQTKAVKYCVCFILPDVGLLQVYLVRLCYLRSFEHFCRSNVWCVCLSTCSTAVPSGYLYWCVMSCLLSEPTALVLMNRPTDVVDPLNFTNFPFDRRTSSTTSALTCPHAWHEHNVNTMYSTQYRVILIYTHI